MRRWPSPWVPIPVGGYLRSTPEDFRVEELMQDLPGGEGAIWLQVEKTRLNTAHVAAHLAQFLGLPEHEIGHAGLKDRAAVTV